MKYKHIALLLTAEVLSFSLIIQAASAAETYSPFYTGTQTSTSKTSQASKSTGVSSVLSIDTEVSSAAQCVHYHQGMGVLSQTDNA